MKWAVSFLLFVVGFVVSYTGVVRTELSAGVREAIAWRSVVVGLVVAIVYFRLHSWLARRHKGKSS